MAQHSTAFGAKDLPDLSLEQLSNIVVTSAARREEPLNTASASIFVISAQDIRRSGATTLPEALRLAPNLQVARADANQYAISARGFANTLANKLLVLVDGRTVYTPLYAGVFWEAQHVLLEDVERIEVISGPGATLWGANAVNGVINVITRRASDTHGTLVALNHGTKENGQAVRYGAAVGEDKHFRAYALRFARDNTKFGDGTPIRDAALGQQVGFRIDGGDQVDRWTVQGDAYSSQFEQEPGKRPIGGGNILARWTSRLDNGSRLRVQTYYDRTERKHPGVFRQKLDIYDLEFQHDLGQFSGHQVMWGGGHRHAHDRIDNGPTLGFFPQRLRQNWSNLFIQDAFALNPQWEITAGLKAERNDYTGTEYLPNLRVSYTPNRQRMVWGAYSRAVRAPTRFDRDLFAPTTPPHTFTGGTGFESEVADVLELGYRAQQTTALSYSATLFHHQYDKLRSFETTAGVSRWGNQISGHTTGVEMWGNYRVSDNWRLSGGWVGQHIKLHAEADSNDALGPARLGNDPDSWWSLRSSMNLTPAVEMDLAVRRVNALPNPSVPGYTAVDMRLAWQASANVNLSLVIQNMFDSQHPEWGNAASRAELERAAMFKLVWRL